MIIGMVCKKPNHSFERAGRQEADIVVQGYHELATRCADSCIPATTRSQIRAELDELNLRAELPHDISDIVLRVIVNHNDFLIWILLGDNGGECLFKRSQALIVKDDDTD
jgi:hypothetical protein